MYLVTNGNCIPILVHLVGAVCGSYVGASVCNVCMYVCVCECVCRCVLLPSPES